MKTYLILVREKNGKIRVEDVCDDTADALVYSDYVLQGNDLELMAVKCIGRMVLKRKGTREGSSTP